MTDLIRATGSPVRISITRAKSPVGSRGMSPVAERARSPRGDRTRSPRSDRCESGRECIRTTVRPKSADDRADFSNNKNNISTKQHLSPMRSSSRSNSSERPRSARRRQPGSTRLQIPSITIQDASADNSEIETNYNSHTQETNRSRSPSPFDWLTREKLPCGSPTFEKVMCDMLSDTEISPKSSDTEQSDTSNSKDTIYSKNNKKHSKQTLKLTPRRTYRQSANSKLKV